MSAKIISVYNQKGGAGKTALTFELACMLRHLGFMVLCLDIDQQLNLTKRLKKHQSEIDISEILLGKQQIAVEDIKENLWLVPGSVEMKNFEAQVNNLFPYENRTRLKSIFHPFKDRVDFILIDCPPALNLATDNAFAASDHVIIPINSSDDAIDGAVTTCAVVDQFKSINPTLNVIGVVRNMLNLQWKNDKEVYDNTSSEFGRLCFDNYIRRSTDIEYANNNGIDILDYQSGSELIVIQL